MAWHAHAQHTEREDIPCQLLTPAEPAVAETAHNARADARESVLSQSHVVYRVKTRRPASHTLHATFLKKISIYQNRSSKIAANGHSQDAMRELTSSVVHRLSACRAWRRRTLASDFAQVSLSPPKDNCRTVSARSRQQGGTGVVTGSIRLGSTSCSARNLAILIIQRSTPNSKALSPAPTVSRACSRTQVGRSSYYFTVPAGACQAAY